MDTCIFTLQMIGMRVSHNNRNQFTGAGDGLSREPIAWLCHLVTVLDEPPGVRLFAFCTFTVAVGCPSVADGINNVAFYYL